MKYCCKTMEEKLVKLDNSEKKNHSVVYDDQWRIYTIIFQNNYKKEEKYLTEISYCPWCGTKLPSDLSDKWWDVLEEEYGITDPRNDEYDQVPAEFRTDEWWRKRGL